MAIFKDTLPDFVQNQLIARERVIAQSGTTNTPNTISSRDGTFLAYTTGKNSWVKMQSFVNVDKKIGSIQYSGNLLAQKYVLEGGTLFSVEEAETKKVISNLRYGVGKQRSVYGGNIDEGGNRPFGYRPMPGITSVQVTNKSAYGSLREATVKFYCWDKHQLEELELLYMRTGYSVLLEWGWSQYLDSSNATTSGTQEIKMKTFDSQTINAFDTKNYNTDDSIYNKIDKLHEETHGNYDAMLGYVKNFSWSLMQNGGFECTTVLISRGEVISALKLNNNSELLNIDKDLVINQLQSPLSQFEQIFYNYAALLNNNELRTDHGQFGNTFGADESLYRQIDSLSVQNFVANVQTIAQKFDLKDDSGNKYNILDHFDVAKNYSGGILISSAPDNQTYGYGVEYVRFDVIMALISLYFNIKDENNKMVTQILIPKNNLCLATKNSVTIDPLTCIIKNSQAVDLGDSTVGFSPLLKKDFNADQLNAYNSGSTGVTVATTDADMDEFLSDEGRGKIGSIYIALPKVIDVYRSKMQKDSTVNLIDFMKTLLNDISKALGGINNFQLHTTKSQIEVIDVKYLERDKTNKAKLNLMGLKSICRDVRMTSRIFESQSTMIGIAAGSKKNVGDLYSQTQVSLNAGLTDRLLQQKSQEGKVSVGANPMEKSFEQLKGHLVRITGRYVGTTAYTIFPTPQQVSSAASVLRTYYLQKDKKYLGNTAIIPFELEITLDGISGIIIGNIFTIDTDILPQSYSDAKVGFVVTGVSHTLQKNDWSTVIKAQIVNLD